MSTGCLCIDIPVRRISINALEISITRTDKKKKKMVYKYNIMK